MPRLVALYVRISRDDVGDQTSTARQDRLCRQVARERGWQVAEVFKDVDKSAYAPGVHREGYERLLASVTDKRFDAILVWRLDRLVRSPAEFERLWSICQRSGVALTSATEPVDSSDPIGVAIIRLLVTFAGLESDVKSIRLRAKNREVAEAGHPPSGARRFGHTAGFGEIVEAEAALIREAAERVLGGQSTTAIVEDWRRRGVAGVSGQPWSRTGLRSMLRSRRLVGERTYRGEVVAADCWPAILEPLVAAQVRNQMAGRPGGGQRRPSASLLQGRVRCGLCGTPMHSRGRKDRPRYVCPPPRGCGRVSMDRPALEEWVSQTVVARLHAREPGNHRVAVDRRLADQTVRRLDEQSQRLEELNRRYYVTAELTYPEWVRARDGLLLSTEAALAGSTLPLPPGYPPGRRLGEAGRLWPQLSMTARRGVIGSELAWVSIGPSPSRNGVWCPERISPQWHRAGPLGVVLPKERDRPRRLHGQWDRTPGRAPRPSDEVSGADELRQLERPLTEAEACVLTGLSQPGLAHHVVQGRLPFELHAGRRRYEVGDLDALPLRSKRRAAAARRAAEKAAARVEPGLSVWAVGRYLRVGPVSVRRLVAEGKLHPVTGAGERFELSETRACVERCRI